MATKSAPIDPKLLEILRCPVAVHYTDKDDDPGRLEVVRDTWLYCEDSGYKYPIIDGIPKMLVEEGAKWQNTEIDDLPVPPPNEPVFGAAEEALPPEAQAVANELSQNAATTRSDAAKQLRETAQGIRQEAARAENSAVSTRAGEIATGLEAAATYVEGNTPNTPAMTQTSKTPLRLLVFLFAVGLVIGIIMGNARK